VAEVYNRLAAAQGGAEIAMPDVAPAAELRDPSATTLMLAAIDSEAGFTSSSWMGREGEVDADVAPSQSYAVFAATPYSNQLPVTNTGNASAFGRSPLKLSASVVQMLSSLDPLALVAKAKEKEDEEKTARRQDDNPSVRIPINLS
jgi:hypothetical protein